jgi:hypothetical protein
MNRSKFLLPAAILLLLFPGAALAHSPTGFMRASLVVVVIGVGLGLFVKRKLMAALFKVKDAPGVGVYIGVAVLEVIILWFSTRTADLVSTSGYTLAILLMGCLIYLLPATLLNFYLVRTATARMVKAFLFAIVSPISIFASTLLLFVPLYTMFGG